MKKITCSLLTIAALGFSSLASAATPQWATIVFHNSGDDNNANIQVGADGNTPQTILSGTNQEPVSTTTGKFTIVFNPNQSDEAKFFCILDSKAPYTYANEPSGGLTTNVEVSNNVMLYQDSVENKVSHAMILSAKQPIFNNGIGCVIPQPSAAGK